jgi:muramoyltetrapeptide carboxypeptidase LdcA involved in peptidoglycan recycling
MDMIKPPRLREGSTIAVISPSLGGPHAFPKVYARGVEVLRDEFGLKVVEMEHTCAPQYYLRWYPHVRGEDVNRAFLDPQVDGIIASIGGHDSLRALPFLDTETIIRHPKVLMGFSDTSTLLTHLCRHGLITFYGPSVMAGISQMGGRSGDIGHVKDILFHPRPTYEYRPSPSYSEGYPDWSDDSSIGKVNSRKRSPRWKVLQGHGMACGRLFGGCIEVLDNMMGTRFWPPKDFWKDKMLFLEMSEEVPSPSMVKLMLRNYGIMGALDAVAGILFGRPRGYTRHGKAELERAIRDVIAGDFHLPDLPIVVNLDFGHTDPQMVLPLGAKVEVNLEGPSLRLMEPAVR